MLMMPHSHLLSSPPVPSHLAQESSRSSAWPQVPWGWGTTTPSGAFTRGGSKILHRNGRKQGREASSSPLQLAPLKVPAPRRPQHSQKHGFSWQLSAAAQWSLLASPTREPPSQVLPDICLELALCLRLSAIPSLVD